MKGAIFIALNEMIESQYGIDVWEDILNAANPESGGIYTSTENYSDEEICKFVRVIAQKMNLEGSEVTSLFGRYLFGELNRKHPIFSQLKSDLFSFIESIEGVIHKEVRKLYENPSLPTLVCKRESDKLLHVEYSSPRKLCHLAEGLILGASDYYKNSIEISHNRCMHKGAESCYLQVKING